MPDQIDLLLIDFLTDSNHDSLARVYSRTNSNRSRLRSLLLYCTRCTQLPLIESSFNGCQGHPPLCLPPGTAQQLPDRIETMFGRVAIYSTNSSRWHKCKSGWSLKTEKIHLNWHVFIDTTHTIRHLFLTWTSLYPFTFLKLNSEIYGAIRLLFSLTFDLQYHLNCT